MNSITFLTAFFLLGQQTRNPAQDHLLKEMADKYSTGVFWVIAMGMMGVAAIVCVTFLWHRYRKRMIRLDQKISERRENTAPLASAWESAADRIDDKNVKWEYGETDPQPPEGAEIDDALDADYDQSDWDQTDWNPDEDDKGELDDKPDDGPRLW